MFRTQDWIKGIKKNTTVPV